jgi:hypothetical protein
MVRLNLNKKEKVMSEKLKVGDPVMATWLSNAPTMVIDSIFPDTENARCFWFSDDDRYHSELFKLSCIGWSPDHERD